MPSLLVLLMAALSVSCMAQELPEAPKPHPDKVEWSLIAADAAVRTIDTVTTRHLLSTGDKERFLPGFIVNHDTTMVIYSAGVVVFYGVVSRTLERHGHKKLAHIIVASEVIMTGSWDVNNLMLYRSHNN